MNVPIAQRATHWRCPECHRTDVTAEPDPHSHFHQCPKLGGAWAPFVEEGVRARLVRQERDDYVGKEIVTCDANGRPVMAIVTERDDGQDCHVFAPCAAAHLTAG